MGAHRLQEEWLHSLDNPPHYFKWWKKKKKNYLKRDIQLLQVSGNGQLIDIQKIEAEIIYTYRLHLDLLLKHGEDIYNEENDFAFQMRIKGNEVVAHRPIEIIKEVEKGKFEPDLNGSENVRGFRNFVYDRRKAVQYAERWWNEYNPAYQHFEDDCTNYISQCLRAGGAPMWGEPNRARGWWYSGTNWSYSWTVSNALRWYFASSNKGLTAKEVEKASDLLPGDVIFYDFEGDGKWNHTTIVVAKDGNGEPLVNAHTQNSRYRYWSYEDSPAWTNNCQYKFFRIGG